jgi:hypothetical protein
MEKFGTNYLEERNLVTRWTQPIPAVVNEGTELFDWSRFFYTTQHLV